MGLTPEVHRTLACNAVEDAVGPDVTREMIAGCTGGFYAHLAQLTGKGVVPDTPRSPVLTPEERAEARRQRQEAAARKQDPTAAKAAADEAPEVE